MSKKLEKHFQGLRWVDFPEGGIVAAYQHLPNGGVTPRAYQCVGKRNNRKGDAKELVLLELCFELDVEQEVDGQLHGSATPLPGRYATGRPLVVAITKLNTLIIKNLEYRPWESGGMRFSIPARSHALTNAAGKRFFTDEKKPQE